MRIFLLILFLSVPSILLSSGKEPTIFIESGKQGLKDEDGNILIPAKFDRVGWSKGEVRVVGNCVGYLDNGNWGLVSLDNRLITQPIYRELVPAGARNIIASRQDPSMRFIPSGVIDAQGKTVIPFGYLRITAAGDRFIVEKYADGEIRFGIIDNRNSLVLQVQFKEIIYLNRDRFAVRNDSGKWALFDAQGKPVSAFAFDHIQKYEGEYAEASVHHAKGLLDVQGSWVVQPAYASIKRNGSSVEVIPFANWDVLTENNQKLHSVEFDSVLPWQQEAWKVVSNGHEWIVDTEFKPLTPNSYNHIEWLAGGLMLFSDNGKYGVIQADGNVIIKPMYDTLFEFKDRIYAYTNVGVDRGWNLFGTNGKKLTEISYQRILPEQASALIPVKRNLKWGLLQKDGREAIACTFDSVGMSIPGKIVVEFREKTGIIDESGDWVQTPKEGTITLIDDQFYLEHRGNVNYLKNIGQGTVYFTENPLEIKEGYLIETRGDNSFWKINFSGQILNTSKHQEYEEIRLESEGFIAVKLHGRYGFIDRQDRLRIANRYDDVTDFREGLAGYKLLGKWGFLNQQEGIVIQPRFDEVSAFSNGLCIVKVKENSGVIDRKGNWVIQPEYEVVKPLSNGRYLIVKDHKAGLLDADGRIIVGAKYDNLTDIEGGQVIVERNGKFGLVSRKGDDLIPISYDYLVYDAYNDCYLGMKKTVAKTIPIR